eukprot:6442853-Ditylum_brightwellii.AAC.1
MWTQLQLCQMPDIEFCNQWLKENAPAYTPEENAPIPKFRLTTAKASWGNGDGHVETLVLKLLCTKKDGLYLKSLLSHAWGNTSSKECLSLQRR